MTWTLVHAPPSLAVQPCQATKEEDAGGPEETW